MTATADVIIAANPSVAETLQLHGHTAALIPYGCDFGVFGRTHLVSPAQDIRLVRPMAVFMGHLGDRIDLEILEAVAESNVSLLIVGPLHPRTDLNRFNAVLAHGNVQWVGERPFEDLPRYLAHAEVGILPYTHSKFNIGSFPLKVLEYLAASLPVVATGLPAISWLNSPHIDIAEGPQGFTKAVLERLGSMRDETGDSDRRAFAAGHSWEARARSFLEAMNLAAPSEAGTTSISDVEGQAGGLSRR
ncbi:glycosyltransferase [Specibacter sp. NPDC078692]|uniref:glycosyltransferase n=1 Tax=Specibacter sp. NPDC078692 TaxID=3155818 RepID=UPI003432CBB4